MLPWSCRHLLLLVCGLAASSSLAKSADPKDGKDQKKAKADDRTVIYDADHPEAPPLVITGSTDAAKMPDAPILLLKGASPTKGAKSTRPAKESEATDDVPKPTSKAVILDPAVPPPAKGGDGDKADD